MAVDLRALAPGAPGGLPLAGIGERAPCQDRVFSLARRGQDEVKKGSDPFLTLRRFNGRGYALLACPHDATAEYLRPHVCELFPAEYPAHCALVDSTISAGEQFFFWLAPFDYFLSA